MANTVADHSPAVAAMQADWTLARALLGGTKAMREAGQTFLPKWPDEEQLAYEFRLKVSVLFPAYKRTVETLTGKPFSKPITVGDDVPEDIKGWLDNVDLEGRNLDAFAADQMECAMGYGLSGILVEHPDAEKAGVQKNAQGVTTLAAEKEAGLRPYFVHIKPGQILGWRAERIQGQWRLTQFRFLETIEEPDGAFGVKCIEQVRVLEPGRWETHRKDDKGDWLLYEQGVTTLSFIPFVPVYGKRKGFMLGEPPLLEVAHLNVKHWQSQSDQDNLLHIARVPILAARMVGDKFKITAGAGAAVNLGDHPDADLKFVEHSGAAIGAGKVSLDDLKEEMRQAGAELLVIKPGDITATEVQTENAVGMCALQRIVQGLEDALDTALGYMAAWVKNTNGGGHVTVFNDFGAATLAEASAQLLLDANMAGKLSDETFHSELQRRGIVSADRDWKTEKERLEAQGPALGEMEDPAAQPQGVPA
jgi:hypothetical protein